MKVLSFGKKYPETQFFFLIENFSFDKSVLTITIDFMIKGKNKGANLYVLSKGQAKTPNFNYTLILICSSLHQRDLTALLILTDEDKD